MKTGQKKEWENVTFTLTKDLYRDFKKKCDREGRTRSKVIRVLIEKFLKSKE